MLLALASWFDSTAVVDRFRLSTSAVLCNHVAALMFSSPDLEILSVRMQNL